MLHVLTLIKKKIIIFFFSPMMHVIEIVKMGSAYKHLLLLLPFQSDSDNL